MYGKHFASMYERSMVGKGAMVFAVMGYVIANYRLDKTVGAQVTLNPVTLSAILGEPQAEVQKAIDFLCSPDPKSTSKSEEGRRLVKIGEYDYRVVNGAHYTRLRNEEERREANRLAQQRVRDKKPKRSKPDPNEQKYLKNVDLLGQEKADQLEASRQDAIAVRFEEKEKQAEALRLIYPRKGKNEAAKKAIKNALDHFDYAFLETKTKEYAAIRGDNMNSVPSVPLASTWFNQKRFNEEPETWKAYEDNKRTNAKGFDRNKGTFSEGIAHIYKAKPIPPTKPPV